MCVFARARTCVYVSVSVFVSVFVSVSVPVPACVCVSVSVRLSVCLCVCERACARSASLVLSETPLLTYSVTSLSRPQTLQGEEALGQRIQEDLSIAARIDAKRIAIQSISADDSTASSREGVGVGVEVVVWGGPQWHNTGIRTADAMLVRTFSFDFVQKGNLHECSPDVDCNFDCKAGRQNENDFSKIHVYAIYM